MAQYELNLRDYWQIVRKQRRTIALTTVLVALASFGLSQLLKPAPQYEATASVKYDRSSNFTGLFMEVMTYSYADDITSQTEVIKSYPVIEAAARLAGLVAPETPTEQIRREPELLATVLNLQRRVKAEREGNTNIIRVTVTAGRPEAAEQLANSVVEAYQQENIYQRNRQVDEAQKFIEQQMSMVETQLRAAEAKVEEFKRTNDVVDLSEEVKVQLTEMARVESEHAKTLRTLEELTDQIDQLRRQGSLSLSSQAGSPAPADPARIFTEEAAAQIFMLNSRLMDLLQERDTLLISYHPGHPQVKDLDQKIQVIREEMLRELSAKRGTFQRREAQLGERLADFKKQYFSVPEKALQLARIERDVKINNDIYLLLKTKYQEALIKGAEKIIEVTQLQPAFASAVPINVPNVLLNVLVGALIGCLLGLLIGFIQESFDTSLGTIEDVESFLGLPVLGVLPPAGADVMKYASSP
ncbi:MAG: Wzz/FepE/Etk N-terminal domain-containing protein, partial [Nitrospirota bacterium]